MFLKRNDKVKPHERHVKANDREFNRQFNYADNSIKTSRYTLVTFLPFNLFEQFKRLANLYFLGLLILKCVPHISPLTPITTAFPLLVVLGTTAVKDGYDDYQRHLSDKKVNNRMARVVRNGAAVQVEWNAIGVGDVVRLENNEQIPADVLVLSCSDPNGSCFVETSELDGETNLKCRQCLKETMAIGDSEQSAWSFDAEAVTELPNSELYKFEGRLNWQGSTHPLTNNNILLRGCVLRNTQWCYGLVIFSGSDTKIMKNGGKAILKRTSIDRLLNKMVVGAVIALVSMCAVCVIGKAIWEGTIGRKVRLYLPWDPFLPTSEVTGGLLYCVITFASYVIALNTVIPISLYVSVELIRLAHSLLIHYDDGMVDPGTGKSAEARSTTLNEDLGQIEYIFSDKTGTLTENVMQLNKCSIGGVDFGRSFETPRHDFRSYAMFFRILAVCHSAIPSQEDGELVYQAQSPDEKALLIGCRKAGFVFKERTSQSITVEAQNEETETYSILATLEFDNVRKRMSVVVRCPDGRVRLFCKGADTSILDNLSPGQDDVVSKTNEHLNDYAIEGLRTLCISYRDIDVAYFEDWNRRYKEALLANQRDRVSELTETLERQLVLVGATGIEDKLQEGVPQTIETLRVAGIKFWVLTGDKKETAVNIAYSCRLFTRGMIVHSIFGDCERDVLKQLQELGNVIDSYGRDAEEFEDSERRKFGIVINGLSLAYALNPSVEETFSSVAAKCDAVVCCRATPVQKSMLVECVKRHTGAVALAIGDGANDVPMIERADIGIGINGQEGAQAVLASDYSIARFRFLQRLLLVHGRLSYLRMSKYLEYFFYKTFAACMGHFWFAFACGFSAQSIYSGFFIALYNICYTSLPVLVLGIVERDVGDRDSVAYPKLYTPGQKNMFFNTSKFLKSVMHGTVTSAVAFLVTCMTYKNRISGTGHAMDDITVFENVFAAITMHAVTVDAIISSSYHTVFNFITTLGSYAFFFFSHFFYDFITKGSFYSSLTVAIGEPTFWLALGLVDACLYVPTLALGFYENLRSPTLPTRIKLARQKRRGYRQRHEIPLNTI